MNYGYIRVSTDKQQLSMTAQQERVEAYCKFKGISFDGIYHDEDVSGSTPIAKRMKGAMLCADLNKGDSVIAVKLDRCFRDASDGINTVFGWQKKGITLHLADTNAIADTSTASGFLTIAMQLVIAQYERMVTGERTSQALKSAQANGKVVTRADRVPYGYQVGEAGSLVPDPDEALMIVDACVLRKDGKSYSDVASRMNMDGRLLRGKKLTRQSVRRMCMIQTPTRPALPV